MFLMFYNSCLPHCCKKKISLSHNTSQTSCGSIQGWIAGRIEQIGRYDLNTAPPRLTKDSACKALHALQLSSPSTDVIQIIVEPPACKQSLGLCNTIWILVEIQTYWHQSSTETVCAVLRQERLFRHLAQSLCQEHCLGRVIHASHFKGIAELRETLLFKPIWQTTTCSCPFIPHTPHTPHALWERVCKMILVDHVLPGVHGKSDSPGTGVHASNVSHASILAQKEAQKGKTKQTRCSFCSFCIVSSANE